MQSEIRDLWSCGGGTQSAAIAALIVRGDLPKPDLSIIVDTERERESTWQYYDNVLKPELARVGVDLVRVRKSEYTDTDLYGGADDTTLLLPAFFNGDGKIGKMRGFCSGEWKRNIVRRWARSRGMQQGRLWLGISSDEPKRIRADTGVSWLSPYYPLGPLDLRYSRAMCIRLVSSMGWPRPPRSHCWMCPNASNADWETLHNEYPEDFEKACNLDEEIRKNESGVYLHRTCKPLRDVTFDEDMQMNLGDMCAGMCFV